MLALLLLCSLGCASAACIKEFEEERPTEGGNRIIPGDPLTASFKCVNAYWLGEKITCQFTVSNNHNFDYYVLKRHTPLEGMQYGFISVSRNGEMLPYDGLFVTRTSLPGPEEYLLLKAGTEVTADIDLSLAYAMHVSGEYTVQMQAPLHYHNIIYNTTSMDTKQTFTSMATFQLFESGKLRKTLGEYYRQEAIDAAKVGVQQMGFPRDPAFTGGTQEQQLQMKEIHRASYHYISAANDDIDNNRDHYISWFGAEDANRIQTVKRNYQNMKSTVENDQFTYFFNGPACQHNWIAYTQHGSRTIFLCDIYYNLDSLLGVDTQMSTIVHELSHAVSFTIDVTYGRQSCLDLARTRPNDAIINAANYAYLSETTNIFDYGFDSITVWTNGYTYATRGNTYIRFSDAGASAIDSGYPALIKGNWGNLPDAFNAGFESMIVLPNKKKYITKGNQYMRYTDNDPDAGYPLVLQGNWGNLNPAFASGFDSAVVWSDGKSYVTRGSNYIRYSDTSGSTVDSGYPIPLQGNRGTLPPSFANSFDSMVCLNNGKVYVTKDKEYIRYTNDDIDPGYPRPIKGNWGHIDFPGPQ